MQDMFGSGPVAQAISLLTTRGERGIQLLRYSANKKDQRQQQPENNKGGFDTVPMRGKPQTERPSWGRKCQKKLFEVQTAGFARHRGCPRGGKKGSKTGKKNKGVRGGKRGVINTTEFLKAGGLKDKPNAANGP